MIVWLNGASGAGKTAVAQQLVRLLPGSVLFDAEAVGVGLRGMLPRERLAEVDDVRELPAWRRLVADTAAALLLEVSGPLVVPAALLREEWRDEIFGALAARRIPVWHFLLHTAETIPRVRVAEADHGTTPAANGVNGAPVPRSAAYQAALPWLTEDAHPVDTSSRTPRQTAEVIGAALGTAAGHCRIVQTSEPTSDTVAAGVLFFDAQDRVLLVDPTYKSGWEFPGGVVDPGESPAQAAVREVAEELGLRLPTAPSLLVLDWEPPRPPRFGGLRLLFDGGRLPADRAQRLLLPPEELRDWRFVTPAEADRLLTRDRRARLHWALRARVRGHPIALEGGRPLPHGVGTDVPPVDVPVTDVLTADDPVTGGATGG